MILLVLALAVVLAAAGFAFSLYLRSANQRRAVESAAQANRAAVFREVAAQAGQDIPALGVDGAGVAMGRVPAGTLVMGSLDGEVDEAPVHSVTVDAFYIDVFEVTNRLYRECVEARACPQPFSNRSQRRDPYYGSPEYEQYPVVFVSYQGAAAFCAWRGARLPSEAEWEKAARGGLEGEAYPWGNEDPVCTPGAQDGANHDRCTPAETWPVGSFAPNGYGLYDLAGNVWEWTADWYDNNYDPEAQSLNPTGPGTGLARVLRGGAWNLTGWHLRVTNRLKNYPVDSNYNIGFRCARTP
jgi:serine/threonine-protein kinase